MKLLTELTKCSTSSKCYIYELFRDQAKTTRVILMETHTQSCQEPVKCALYVHTVYRINVLLFLLSTYMGVLAQSPFKLLP